MCSSDFACRWMRLQLDVVEDAKCRFNKAGGSIWAWMARIVSMSTGSFLNAMLRATFSGMASQRSCSLRSGGRAFHRRMFSMYVIVHDFRCPVKLLQVGRLKKLVELMEFQDCIWEEAQWSLLLRSTVKLDESLRKAIQKCGLKIQNASAQWNPWLICPNSRRQRHVSTQTLSIYGHHQHARNRRVVEWRGDNDEIGSGLSQLDAPPIEFEIDLDVRGMGSGNSHE